MNKLSNSKILCISDIHNRVKIADQILEFEKGNFDKVIYIGDFFDSYSDNPNIAKDTAIWLKEKLANSSNIMLCGNHDHAQKYYTNKKAYCSGFTYEKAKAIREVMNQDDFDKLKQFHIENGILFSHAGLCYWFLDMLKKHSILKIKKNMSLKQIENLLNKLVAQADQLYSTGYEHPLYMAGFDRGGSSEIGGLSWRDFGGTRVLDGIRQIIGHSILKSPIFKYQKKEELVNISYYGDPVMMPQQYYAIADEKESKFDQIIPYFKDGFTLDFDTNNNNYIILEKIDKNRNNLKIYKIKFDKEFDRENPYAEQNIIGSELIFNREV